MLGNVYIRFSLKQAFLYTYNKQVLPKESTLRHHLRFEHHLGVKELSLYGHYYWILKRWKEKANTVILITSDRTDVVKTACNYCNLSHFHYWIPGPSMQLPFFLIWSTYSDTNFWSSYSSSTYMPTLPDTEQFSRSPVRVTKSPG